ncbi:hypothetical protein J4E08_19680 [Sagittula sp. NFXS13]|uniref:hypothetical protein n=1 Tax=Sagittula sp. NFXS13 TaxID=2819095 RepID=UPI0032E03FAC
MAAVVATTLQSFVDLDQLLSSFSDTVASKFSVEAATVTHCTAASITLAVAAAICARSPDMVARLPVEAERNVVLIQRPHVVNYGQSILQAIRLSGALPRVIGDANGCTEGELAQALGQDDLCCLLLVESRLCGPGAVATDRAVVLAEQLGVPSVLDAAAQDLRLRDVLQNHASLTLISPQKYLAGPTAGLVLGRKVLVDALNGQFKGIGRGMKPSKEAVLGTYAALRAREKQPATWHLAQQAKMMAALVQLGEVRGLACKEIPDPCGGPVSRLAIRVEETIVGLSAKTLAARLRAGDPPIHLDDTRAGDGILALELILLSPSEVRLVCDRISEAMTRDSCLTRVSPFAEELPNDD